jgi:hypothetical protein
MNYHEKTEELGVLCSVCLRNYRNTTKRKICRTGSENKAKCDYCGYRMGWEYEYVWREKDERE